MQVFRLGDNWNTEMPYLCLGVSPWKQNSWKYLLPRIYLNGICTYILSRIAQNKYFDILAVILAFQDQQNALPSPLLKEQQTFM